MLYSTYLIVEFAVDGLSVLVDHLEGVGAVAVHVTMAIRDAPVTEQERDLVSGLGTKSDEVPEHVGILSREGRGRMSREYGGRRVCVYM